MQSFLLDLGAILEKWNLAWHLLLVEKAVDRPPTIEFTSGRANIAHPFHIAPDNANIIDVMWQFSSDPSGSSVHPGPTSQPLLGPTS